MILVKETLFRESVKVLKQKKKKKNKKNKFNAAALSNFKWFAAGSIPA